MVQKDGSAAGIPEAAALLLPGMSLNETAYPDLGIPTICPDFNSFIPSGQDGFQGLEPYVERLEEWLASQTDWQAATRIVVGHSFGGMLALQWLLGRRRQELAHIDGLLLIGTTAGPMFDVLRPTALAFAGTRCRVSGRQLMRLWSWTPVMILTKAVLGGGVTAAVDFSGIARPTDLKVGLAGWRNTAWRAKRSLRNAIDGFDVRLDLKTIGTPTVILHGSRDTLFPTSCARLLAESIPGAELSIVRGAPHVLPLTHPRVVREAVSRLLARVRPP